MPSSNVSESVSRLCHLRMVAERIDAQLKSNYGSVLCADILEDICSECGKRLIESVPNDVAPVELTATRLLRKAAGTKLSTPAAQRWEVDPELKPRLKSEFNGYVRRLLGDCPCIDVRKLILRSFEINMPDGSRSILAVGDIGYHVLWSSLSADPNLLHRFLEAYEPFRELIPLGVFRQRLLDLCCDQRVATGEKAIALLGEAANACSKIGMN